MYNIADYFFAEVGVINKIHKSKEEEIQGRLSIVEATILSCFFITDFDRERLLFAVEQLRLILLYQTYN